MSWQRTLVIMVKAPRMGQVKTRLGREVGPVEALRTYRVLLADTLRGLAGDGRWRTTLAVAPDDAVLAWPWPGNVRCFGQGRGDLGARMQRVFERAPKGPCVIIGSDIPGIKRQHIARAFSALGRADLVFGPACDGGYWLVGARRFPKVPRLFANVRWSSRLALADTLENCSGAKVTLLDQLEDVDDLASWRRWRAGMASGRR